MKSKQPERTGDILPTPHYEKGPYKGVVTGQRFGEMGDKKTPFFAVEFEPTEATGANEFPATVYKRELTLYFSEAAAPYSIDNLRRIGWGGSKLTDLDPTSANYHDLSGTGIEVVCDHNDKGYEDWNFLAPGGAAKENEVGVSKRLDALFGKALKASVPKNAEKPADADMPLENEDDEIPF